MVEDALELMHECGDVRGACGVEREGAVGEVDLHWYVKSLRTHIYVLSVGTLSRCIYWLQSSSTCCHRHRDHVGLDALDVAKVDCELWLFVDEGLAVCI